MTDPTQPSHPQPPAAAAPGSSAPFPPPAAVSARPHKPHVLAIIALVTAGLGFIFACIPGALIVGWILLPIGFVLSIVALFLTGAKWPAIVGLIVSIVGTIVGFVVFFAVVANAASTAFNGEAAPVAPGTSTTEAAGGEAPAAQQYAVTIDGATQTQDYEGKPVLVVSYTFTNNSTDDASFLFAVSPKAFQDGVQLDTAIVSDGSVDSGAGLKEIKPGVTITVQEAYVLDSTAEVSVEVTKLISLDDTVIASKTFTVS